MVLSPFELAVTRRDPHFWILIAFWMHTEEILFLVGPSRVTFSDSKSGCQVAPGCATSSVPSGKRTKLSEFGLQSLLSLCPTSSLLGSPRLLLEIWYFALLGLVLCLCT